MSDNTYRNRGHDGQLRVRDMTEDDKRWLIHLQNRLRLAQLEERARFRPEAKARP